MCHCHIVRATHTTCCSVLQCVAVCCSVLQCVAVCCGVLQRPPPFRMRAQYVFVHISVTVACDFEFKEVHVMTDFGIFIGPYGPLPVD